MVMNNIYRIENDGFKFKWLGLEIHDIVDLAPQEYSLKQLHRFPLHNLSLSSWWEKVETTFKPNFDMADAPIPDIAVWLGYASLVLNEKAYDAIGSMLKEFGEFLPIASDGVTYHIFNCRTLVDTDEQHSRKTMFDGLPIGVEKFVFADNHTNDQIVFKSEYNSCVDLFCGDALKNAVEKHQLNGVAFSKDLVPQFD